MCKRLDLSPDAPWKQRFRAAGIWAAEIAIANPDRGLIWTKASGSMQLYAWDLPTNQLTQLTDKPTGVWDGTIAANGQYIYYFDDQQGNELGHYVRIPFIGGEPEDITPDLPPFFAVGLSDNYDSTVLELRIHLAETDQTYLINQNSTGQLSQPRQIKAIHSRFNCFSNRAKIAVFFTYCLKVGCYQLVAMEMTSQEIVGTLSIPETYLFPVCVLDVFSGLKVLVKSVKSDTTQLLIWHVGSNYREYLPVIAYKGELQISAMYEDDLLLKYTHCARQRLYLLNLTTRTLIRLNHPNGSIGATQFIDGRSLFATISDATHPDRLVILSRNTGQVVQTLSLGGSLPPSRSWAAIVFPTRDGSEIQAWLALPLGNPPFPTILHVHGGPASVTTERFDPKCQAWLDHGFAWMSVNYRGSTSFGKEFEFAIQGKPGQLEVEDMMAARDWLVKQGIANPAAVLVNGASYGGYLTLQALSIAPNLWAGGIAEVAFADWFLMVTDSTAIGKHFGERYLGGTPQEKPEAYKAASPLAYAQRIQAPLLVIQGKYDSRCPPQQMREYERKLISLGKNIQVHWFDNGHFQSDVELAIRHQEVMLRFAYRVINGTSSIFTGDSISDRLTAVGQS